jgi:pyridoxal-dependent decarboxylase-like protein
MTPTEGAISRELDALAREYGNRFLLEPAPDGRLPQRGMRSVDAMRLLAEELVLHGIPMRNLATFVTTWMEPEAQRVIAENLHRNYIDHAEYPQTAEIEQRCIRMLADLYHAPGETTGTRTQGSSEAIMLGALSLKWKWRARREAAARQARCDVHAELLHRRLDGAGAVLQLRPFRPRRLPLRHGDDAGERQGALGAHRRDRRLPAHRLREGRAASARGLPRGRPQLRRVRRRIAARRGARLDGPPTPSPPTPSTSRSCGRSSS